MWSYFSTFTHPKNGVIALTGTAVTSRRFGGVNLRTKDGHDCATKRVQNNLNFKCCYVCFSANNRRWVEYLILLIQSVFRGHVRCLDLRLKVDLSVPKSALLVFTAHQVCFCGVKQCRTFKDTKRL